jgi:DNA-binding Lrp family transcriptional regulator
VRLLIEELSKLFDKKTLSVLAEIPGKNFMGIRETARKTNLSVASVYRIFLKLEKAGLLRKQKMGTNSVYSVNSGHKAYFLLDKLLQRKNPIEVFTEIISKEKTEQVLLMDEGENRASIMVIGEIKAAKAGEIADAIKKEFNYSIKALTLTKAQLDNMDALNMKPVPKRVLFKR